MKWNNHDTGCCVCVCVRACEIEVKTANQYLESEGAVGTRRKEEYRGRIRRGLIRPVAVWGVKVLNDISEEATFKMHWCEALRRSEDISLGRRSQEHSSYVSRMHTQHCRSLHLILNSVRSRRRGLHFERITPGEELYRTPCNARLCNRSCILKVELTVCGDGLK